jgi:hypothetical protein
MKPRLKLGCCGGKLYKGERCICGMVLNINTEPNITTNVRLEDIQVFSTISSRGKNDEANKKREQIICDIINKQIPDNYYQQSQEWKKLRLSVWEYVRSLVPDTTIETVECKLCAGRGHHYDFIVTVNGTAFFQVELKFNNVPQFVSPMKPSQYMNHSYEEFYYDNYLEELLTSGGFEIPDKETYLQKIHSPNPECVEHIQRKYYAGCKRDKKQYSGIPADIAFYEKAITLSKSSISHFIEKTELDLLKLSDYLLDTQKGKIMMFYRNGAFTKETVHEKEYTLASYIKDPAKSRFIATTETGKYLNILLRWKNGNGIAYPAFQIKELKNLPKTLTHRKSAKHN